MHKSKTLATWIAILGGGFGLHRFYLHGFRDAWGWAYPLPTMLGLAGVQRMRELGLDDQVAWALVPLLGFALAAAMLSAIVYALTPDERWHRRHNPQEPAPEASGWGAVLGAALALLLGAGVLMATIAFSGQRYFEYQIEEARKISR
ncbi:TM2 domain-containing protein [Piscinibacter sakaiensis]|uniref:Putative transmembrane protein n=1 Tax=Piscinibacter sakaiensis TaxID=1547922 RepID=A0A0K8NTV9_PISS1|nr:TM2 domain-containing protein [Piscinibacter sakaiensis]GAP33822.1 putative transmembrane protein [Piscinibacter sakaiensis]